MASMSEIVCKCGCGRKKMVRTADVNRGWGLYYSKSCKAKKQWRSSGGRRRTFEGLCRAFENETVSKEYFMHCVRKEYPSREDECAKLFHLDSYDFYVQCDVHPFSTEGLGQD